MNSPNKTMMLNPCLSKCLSKSPLDSKKPEPLDFLNTQQAREKKENWWSLIITNKPNCPITVGWKKEKIWNVPLKKSKEPATNLSLKQECSITVGKPASKPCQMKIKADTFLGALFVGIGNGWMTTGGQVLLSDLNLPLNLVDQVWKESIHGET